jgi:hypothetical protein
LTYRIKRLIWLQKNGLQQDDTTSINILCRDGDQVLTPTQQGEAVELAKTFC